MESEDREGWRAKILGMGREMGEGRRDERGRSSSHPTVFQALLSSCDSALDSLLCHVGDVCAKSEKVRSASLLGARRRRMDGMEVGEKGGEGRARARAQG